MIYNDLCHTRAPKTLLDFHILELKARPANLELILEDANAIILVNALKINLRFFSKKIKFDYLYLNHGS